MITFPDKPNFITCYTPVEMFQMGIFGNAYFQIETNNIPQEFLRELIALKYQRNKKPDISKNKYQIDCGSSLQWWLDKNLIHNDDPNGWVEWYIKFYYGRRHEDDTRQINRFRAFVSRHMGMLKNYPNSLKTKQNLLQWAWNYQTQNTW